MDIGTISTILSSLKTATDIAKFIKDSGITLKDAETKLKLADLISALADAKIEIAAVQQTLIDKDTEILKLQDQLKIKGNIRWEDPYYWLIDNDKKDGPYCQQCYDKNGDLIRLQGDGRGFWDCRACKSDYTDSKGRAFIAAQVKADTERVDIF